MIAVQGESLNRSNRMVGEVVRFASSLLALPVALSAAGHAQNVDHVDLTDRVKIAGCGRAESSEGSDKSN